MAELKNMGPQGRRHLVEKWRGFLPKYGDPPFNQQNGHSSETAANTPAGGVSAAPSVSGAAGAGGDSSGSADEMDTEDDMEEGEGAEGESSDSVEYRRNQTTAVILFGVIGALFDLEVRHVFLHNFLHAF